MAKTKSRKQQRLPGPPLAKAKSVNPFSIHHNRKKFDILGQKRKGTQGLPGVSRQRAIELRSETLLKEYINRNKANVFLDKRDGKHLTGSDLNVVIEQRHVDEVKKKLNKQSIYNLSDDVLTHDDVPLSEKDVNYVMSDEEIEEDGMLDAQFVRQRHFGGGDIEESANEVSCKKYQTQKDRLNEIIAEHKMRKLQAKNEKEAQAQRISELDSMMKHFISLNDNFLRRDDALEEDPMKDFRGLMRKLHHEPIQAVPSERLKSEEEIAKEEKERLESLEKERLARMNADFEEHSTKIVTRSVDTLDAGHVEHLNNVPVLNYKDGQLVLLGSDGKPITPDGQLIKPKLSREEQRRLKKQARMEKRLREEERRLCMKESDEEEGDCDGDENEDFSEENEEAENDNPTEDDADSQTDDGSSDVCDDPDADHEDDYSDILLKADSDDEFGGEGMKSRSFEIKTKKRVSFADDQKLIEEALQQDISFTVDVPADFSSFWSLIQNRSPDQVSTIVCRMIASNHPKLKHSNKLKCFEIFSYLLQTVHVLCSPDEGESIGEGSTMHYVDILVPYFHELTKASPEDAARALLLVFLEKRDEYRSKVKKRFPYLDTLIFIQLAGLLFPASDFFHPVMTPLKTFLTQLLAEAKMKNARDVVAALYVATLLHEYIYESSRYSSELLLRLQGLLLSFCPLEPATAAAAIVKARLGHYLPVTEQIRQQKQKKKCQQNTEQEGSSEHWDKSSHVPLEWLLHPTLPPYPLLQLQTKNKITSEIPKFDLTLINCDTLTFTDEQRCRVLLCVIKLLTDLCQHWAELPSVQEIMSPMHVLLPLLPRQILPDELLEAIHSLEVSLNNLPPHPPRLRVDKGRPKPLRMLEPLIQDVKVTTQKKSILAQKQQRQRLLHSIKRERKAATREIKKDNAFIARQKLKETLKSDAVRKKKVNIILNDLRHQQGEYNKYNKLFKRKKRL